MTLKCQMMKLTEDPHSDYPMVCLCCVIWPHFYVCSSSSLVQPRWNGAQRKRGSDCQLVRRFQPLLCCSTKTFYKLSKQVSIRHPLPMSVQINRYKDVAHTSTGRNKTDRKENMGRGEEPTGLKLPMCYSHNYRKRQVYLYLNSSHGKSSIIYISTVPDFSSELHSLDSTDFIH